MHASCIHDASKFSHSNGALTIPENTARWPYETYINLLIFELAHYKLDQSNPSERIGWYRPASRSFFKNLAIGAKQGQAGMSPAIGDPPKQMMNSGSKNIARLYFAHDHSKVYSSIDLGHGKQIIIMN